MGICKTHLESQYAQVIIKIKKLYTHRGLLMQVFQFFISSYGVVQKLWKISAKSEAIFVLKHTSTGGTGVSLFPTTYGPLIPLLSFSLQEKCINNSAEFLISRTSFQMHFEEQEIGDHELCQFVAYSHSLLKYHSRMWENFNQRRPLNDPKKNRRTNTH